MRPEQCNTIRSEKLSVRLKTNFVSCSQLSLQHETKKITNKKTKKGAYEVDNQTNSPEICIRKAVRSTKTLQCYYECKWM